MESVLDLEIDLGEGFAMDLRVGFATDLGASSGPTFAGPMSRLGLGLAGCLMCSALVVGV